ncbi:hypothetical protein AYI70_g3084 [Smittium culicis]|uniref:Uncharacterized protein n=1 Tax=Smittium culicis TaxID=133412 RepID=A0A1R1Y5G7_9FUNG|nr:hypothetical protein AYI70_g3084 [Smittium culicis]
MPQVSQIDLKKRSISETNGFYQENTPEFTKKVRAPPKKSPLSVSSIIDTPQNNSTHKIPPTQNSSPHQNKNNNTVEYSNRKFAFTFHLILYLPPLSSYTIII